MSSVTITKNMHNFNELSKKLLSELRVIASSLGIADVEKLKKQEIVERIIKFVSEVPQEEEKVESPSMPEKQQEEPQATSE